MAKREHELNETSRCSEVGLLITSRTEWMGNALTASLPSSAGRCPVIFVLHRRLLRSAFALALARVARRKRRRQKSLSAGLILHRFYACFHQFLHQCHWYRFVDWEADNRLRCGIAR
jgi:hypothetical protein